MNIQKLKTKANKNIKAKQFNLSENILLDILKVHPKDIRTIQNLAFVCLQQRKIINAINYLKLFLEIEFDQNILMNLLDLLLKVDNKIDFIKYAEMAISHDVKNKNILLSYAIALRDLGNEDGALENYENLIEIYPNYLDAYISYGFTLNMYSRFKEAISIYKRALQVGKDFRIFYNLGIAHSNNNDHKDAINNLEKAAEYNDKIFDLWATLATKYNKLRNFTNSDLCLKKCNEIESQNPKLILLNATINYHRGNVIEAEKLYEEFLKTDPEHIDANYSLGLTKLMLGKFNEAMKFYRYRTKLIKDKKKNCKFDDFKFPELQVNDEILITWEQGIGDQFIYLNLLPKFIEKYKKITYIVQDKLYEFIKSNYPEITVITDSAYEKNIESYISHKKINIGSLIHYTDSIYEALKEARKLKSTSKSTTIKKIKKRIGVSWESKNKDIGDDKSLDLINLLPFFECKKYEFYSLQYGDNVKNELSDFNKKYNVNIIFDQDIDYFNNLNEVARIIESCDLVITSSNLNAHLAGAMGIKTYLILPKSFGRLWYWYNGDQKSMWYPSVELIKQSEHLSWDLEISRIRNKLLKIF
jgi:tetratricopeptide (TPR) repeat protein